MSKRGDSWNFWKHFSLNLIRKEDFKPLSFEIAPRCFSNELLVYGISKMTWQLSQQLSYFNPAH